MPAAPLTGQAAAALERKPSQSEDLFSAHNFDITINLDLPAPGTGTVRLLASRFRFSDSSSIVNCNGGHKTQTRVKLAN